MMPALDNARHERFAQEIAKGATQIEAYRLAGYEPVEANASRLIRNDKVSARVAELKAAAAAETVTTIYDIARQLDEDREFARQLEAPGPAITATMGKAKVLGMLADKVEHTGANGGPIQTEDISDSDAVGRMLFLIARARKEKVASLN